MTSLVGGNGGRVCWLGADFPACVLLGPQNPHRKLPSGASVSSYDDYIEWLAAHDPRFRFLLPPRPLSTRCPVLRQRIVLPASNGLSYLSPVRTRSSTRSRVCYLIRALRRRKLRLSRLIGTGPRPCDHRSAEVLLDVKETFHVRTGQLPSCAASRAFCTPCLHCCAPPTHLSPPLVSGNLTPQRCSLGLYLRTDARPRTLALPALPLLAARLAFTVPGRISLDACEATPWRPETRARSESESGMEQAQVVSIGYGISAPWMSASGMVEHAQARRKSVPGTFA